MADNTEVIKVTIEGQERAIKSMADLKKARRELTDAAIAGDKDAAASLAKLADKLDDVKDASKSTRGDGIEPLKNSFSLFKDGLANLDLDKIGTAFKGLGSAMKAVPIFLLVEGITYLITNFKELSEGSGLLAKALQFVGDIIDGATDLLYKMTDAIGLTNSALDDMGEAVKTNADKAKEALAGQNAEYDRQIQVAKAAGENTIELEKAKQESIVETNKAMVEQIIAFVRAGGVLDDEKKKLINSSLENIKNAKTQEKIIELNDQKEKQAKYKEHLNELDKKDKELNAERMKREKELDDYRRQIQKDWEAEQDKIKERFIESKAFEEQTDTDYAETGFEKFNNDIEKKKAKEQELKDLRVSQANELAAFDKVNTESQAALVNFLFDMKRSKAKKGSEEDMKLAKRQFQINKALAIQSSIISGIQGVINALSAQSVIPEPYGTVLKVATAVGVGIAATVNTAKIAAQQFNEGGGGGGGEATVGSVGSSATAAPPVPTINTPQNTPQSTAFGEGGKNLTPVVKAQVVETELTSTQKGINRLENQASF